MECHCTFNLDFQALIGKVYIVRRFLRHYLLCARTVQAWLLLLKPCMGKQLQMLKTVQNNPWLMAREVSCPFHSWKTNRSSLDWSLLLDHFDPLPLLHSLLQVSWSTNIVVSFWETSLLSCIPAILPNGLQQKDWRQQSFFQSTYFFKPHLKHLLSSQVHT